MGVCYLVWQVIFVDVFPKDKSANYAVCPLCSEKKHKKSMKRHIRLIHHNQKAPEQNRALAEITAKDKSSNYAVCPFCSEKKHKHSMKRHILDIHQDRALTENTVKRRNSPALNNVKCPFCGIEKHKKSIARHITQMHLMVNDFEHKREATVQGHMKYFQIKYLDNVIHVEKNTTESDAPDDNVNQPVVEIDYDG